METIKMNIAYNKTTQEMVGYWTPKGKEIGIVVTAYSVVELQEKFDKASAIYQKVMALPVLTKSKVKVTAQ